MSSKLIVGAGCFWGVEALFEEMPGVINVVSGYCGGHTVNPTYETICTGATGHIEVVEIEYDSTLTSFNDLLEKFFFIHDPTQFNRQGPDIGEQYKSVIFYNSEEEKRLAASKIEQIDASGEHQNKVAPELREVATFYPAEEYHQDFIKKNGKVCFHQLYVAQKS